MDWNDTKYEDAARVAMDSFKVFTTVEHKTDRSHHDSDLNRFQLGTSIHVKL